MMRSVFIWFYCLPIPDVILLTALAAGVFLFLRERFGDRRFWKAGMVAMLSVWIAVIFLGTLGHRTEGANPAEPVLMPFASYVQALTGGPRELFRTNFMNAVLFCPAGLLGCEILPKRWKKGWTMAAVVCVLAMLSAAIEYCQFRYGLGLAETDDVIHNTLGALAGALVCRQPFPHSSCREK